MTKYTDEEIIAYLKTLREGDVLTAVRNEDIYYTKGATYEIRADEDGDLYVHDNDDTFEYVKIGERFDEEIADYIAAGIFEIPTPLAESIYVSIRQIAEIHPGGIPYKSVIVRVDDAGFAELEALEHRSVKSRELAGLYAQRAELQAEIDRLEAK